MPNAAPARRGSLHISMLAYEQADIFEGELSVLLARSKGYSYSPLKRSIDQTPPIPFRYTLDKLVLELSEAITGNTQREYNKADYLLKKIICVWEELFKTRRQINSKKCGMLRRVYSNKLTRMLGHAHFYIAEQQTFFSTNEYLYELNNGSAAMPGSVILTNKEIAKRRELYLFNHAAFNPYARKS